MIIHYNPITIHWFHIQIIHGTSGCLIARGASLATKGGTLAPSWSARVTGPSHGERGGKVPGNMAKKGG